MPLSYKIGRRVIRLVSKGEVEYATGLSILRKALEEARGIKLRSPALWNVILDVRKSKSVRSADELRGIAMALAQHTDMITGKVAIVAADPVRYERWTLFKEFAKKLGHEPRVFGSLKEAEAWLSK